MEKQFLDILLCFPKYISEFYDRVKPEYFNDIHLRQIYKGIIAVYLDGNEPEIWSVKDYLAKNGMAIDETISVLQTIGEHPNLPNLYTFAEKIYQAFLSRQAEKQFEYAKHNLTKHDAVSTYELLKYEMDALIDSRTSPARGLTEIVEDGEQYRRDLADGKIKKSMIDIPVLTDCVPFLTRKNYIFIISYVRTGKTTLAIDLSANLIRNGDKGIYFTLESNADNLANRFIAHMGDLPYKFIEDVSVFGNDGLLRKYEQGKYDLLAHEDNLIIRDDMFNLESIFNFAIFQKRKNGLDFLVIDYLGLLDFEGQEETPALVSISKRIAKFKKKHDINIIALQQIPNSFMDKNRNPNVIPGKSSGQMSADCDIAIFLERPNYQDRLTNFHVMKNKLLGKVKSDDVYYNRCWNRLISKDEYLQEDINNG